VVNFGGSYLKIEKTQTQGFVSPCYNIIHFE
jgi:hypothetical protein